MLRLLVTMCLAVLALQFATAQNLNTTLRAKMTFPNQTLANVWGFTGMDGREYALLGGENGLIIVDISNPDAPQQIVQIPGPVNLWKEIKTYAGYAYVVTEGGSGIQIINLKSLPSTNLPHRYYRGDGVINNQLSAIHALHIDEKKGFLYAWGGGLFSGGAKIFDLKPDPYNPVYVGKFDQLGYIHDGYVDNDTMYSAHIGSGQFAIVNMANKAAPELLATQSTPNSATHNTWLSVDRKTLFTTDETNNSFLTAYDVSNPLDINQLDKIQSNPGSNSVVHNTYILRNYAVTAWYKDGITIVDVSRPDNLVQVGNYDTYPESGGGYDGCWGVYPYFRSGTLIASNINAPGTGNGELYIITPDYHRACYLEGTVSDAITGLALNNVKMEVLETTPLNRVFSNSVGEFKTGQAKSGYFTVRCTKTGYQPFETTVYLAEGEVVSLPAKLYPFGSLTITGTVLRQSNNQAVESARVILYGESATDTTITDQDGHFSFSPVNPGVYTLIASTPDLNLGILSGKTVTNSSNFTLFLSDKYRRGDAIKQLSANKLLSAENPFYGSVLVRFNLPEPGSTLQVLNSAGQVLESIILEETTGQVEIGQNLPAGLYLIQAGLPGKPLETLKLLKI